MSFPVEQSFETTFFNPVEADLSNEAFDEIGEEHKESIHDSNIIIEDDYGHIKDENGQNIKITKYTLMNKQRVFIEIINYGATVISCWVPNALGELEDVILGFDSIDDYRLRNTYSIGGTLGRVTDYISDGHFKNSKGEINNLTKNRGDHHFNGGKKGFDKVVWDGYVEGNELVLTYSSKDGEEGYPGTLLARITFHLTCKNELVIDYVGMTSKPTPINIASNIFFNLAGHNTGESELINHSVMVNADDYIAIKVPERRPIGLIKNVQHTCLDLRVPRLLKKAFPLVPGFGYNHTFELFKGKEHKAFNLAVSLVHKESGRMMDVYTDMPCVLINTAQDFPNYGKMLFEEEVLKITEIASPIAKFGGNVNEKEDSIVDEFKSTSNLELLLENEQEGEYAHAMETVSTLTNHSIQENKPIIGKSNTVYSKHSGICIRPQLFPDAVTHENFNDTILKPSNLYNHRTVYKFGVTNLK